MEKVAEQNHKNLFFYRTKEEARELFHQKSFFKTSNNLIQDFIRREVENKPEKIFSIRSAAERERTAITLADDENDIKKLIRANYSKDVIKEFENEFNDRLEFFDKNLPNKLKKKNLYKKLFSMWMFSLCTISSMPYVEDDSGLKQFSMFQ